MEARTFLERVRRLNFYSDQVAHVKLLPERPAVYGALRDGLAPAVEAALRRQGIGLLYRHQADAIEHLRAGRNVVVVTGTASGKTLCYLVPVVERLIAEPSATMLFIYPTKALAQDQLRGLGAFQRPEEQRAFLAGTYDGDTPSTLRRKLRDAGNVILTNPDMLHQGILPHHARWNRFFTHLRTIVIDEVHAYRGVFGSHLANVLRRLRRICRHYGSTPQFVCCSATIGNPQAHAERIVGEPMTLVANDGSPRGPKHFVLWNPPPIETAARGQSESWRVGGDRRSPLWEAVHLMTALVKEGVQTIAFVRTRLAAEILFKNARDLLRPVSKKLSESIHAYRGGYLPEERRKIEHKLVSKEILGVASTNALELGIDIGTLDACIMVGYPGTIASLWQQTGRAGRGLEDAVTFLVGQNSPIDQYLMTHSDYLFAQNPEQAVVDPDNPHIVIGHIKCAMFELPLSDADAALFGPYTGVVLELLEEDEAARHIDGHWYWARSEYPAADVHLRNIAGPVYTIQDESEGERVIGTMDEISALSQLHDHAVYLHAAETYFVNQLDLEQKIVRVEKRDLDYYTQSVQVSQIRIDEVEEETAWRGAALGFGDVTVTTTIPMFKKIRFHSRDSLGFERLELPPQELETVAMWFSPPESVVELLKSQDLLVGEALIGIANVLVEVAPIYVMCDTRDIGTVVDASCLGRDALFLHDRYPGGMGYARRCLDAIDDLMRTILTVIRECGCEDGCPSCVGAAVPPFAMTDLDSAVRGRIPNKEAARVLLEALLEQ
ncbi:MAG: DEAD/DEAH box helicase [Verrucomicrobia bacterium]|nr:DEAD/DEAH box helicase [Verrucomicrobiota bacterium]